MRRVFPGLLALFIVILFLSNSSLFSQIVIVTGRVKYGDEVLQSASVTLNNNTNATDRSGVFIFRVNPGNYSIEITHPVFRRLTTMITVSGDSIQNYEFDMIPNGQLEEVAVLGSRSGIERSNLNAPVPVDVFTSDKLIQTGQPDLIQMLNFTAPSLTAARQIGYEPITLRGLDPHHTLILINGIRYHNTAVINNGVPKSNMGRGSPANDVNSISFMAIEKVEILRDGATAQYGSDGIAGILNIKLKESAKGFSIQTHAGQYYQGDGFKVSFGLNGGVSLRKKGFLTYSANVLHRDLTARGGEFTGTIYYNILTGTPPADSARIKALDDSLVLARRIDRKKFSIQNGNAAANSYGFLVNGGYTISHRSELFWTGSVNYLEKLAIGSFRFPKNIAQVNTDIYPDGFYPELDSKCYDVFLIGGLKTETGNGGHLKLISSYGSNSNALDVSNSNNASMYFLGKN